MKNRGVIWDMDGVLVDTGDLHYDAWCQALPEFGLIMPYDHFRDTFGMNNRGVLTSLLGRTPEPELLARISDSKESAFRRLARGNVDVLPGVREWLGGLKDAGYKQAIASSAPQANIDVLVEALGLRNFFQALVSGVDLPGKPDPATFLKAAAVIAVPPDRCVVVEDATAGVEGARRAGMKCIAVTTTNPAAALARADIVVERLDALAPDTFEHLLAN
jgi:HAD superfamily hydrolase (TIGR01509 family)